MNNLEAAVYVQTWGGGGGEKNSRANCETFISLWSSKSFLYAFSFKPYCEGEKKKKKKKKKNPCSAFPLAQRVSKTAASTADATINSLCLLH